MIKLSKNHNYYICDRFSRNLEHCNVIKMKPSPVDKDVTRETLNFLLPQTEFLNGLQSKSGLWIGENRLSIRPSVCPSVRRQQ